MRSTLSALFPSFFSLVLLLSSYGCSDEQGKERVGKNAGDDTTVAAEYLSEAAAFTARIEKAHNAEAFRSHKAVAFDIALIFGGKPRLQGRVTMLTGSGKVLLTRESDGARILFDGADVLLYPADADWPRARFDVLTWSYFFAAPYKLGDPGTELEMLGRLPLEGDSCRAARLTFAPGTGDAPKDWYIVYQDSVTGLMRAMAYIVTYGKSFEDADADPHAITYSRYRDVEGIPVAEGWSFRGWNRESGVTTHGGEASITNVHFIEEGIDSIFQLPAGAVKVPL